MVYQAKKKFDDFSRFDAVHEWDWQTNGETNTVQGQDSTTLYVASRGKNQEQ